MRQFHGMIFFGAGCHSSYQAEGLKDRLEYGLNLLGGHQQGSSNDEEDEFVAREIKHVIEDIAAAFGHAIEIDFDKLDYPPSIENMSLQPEKVSYFIKEYSDSKIYPFDKSWKLVNLEEYAKAIDIHSDCLPYLTLKQAKDALNFLTHGHTAYLDCPSAPCYKFGKTRFYAIFPMGVENEVESCIVPLED